MKVFTSIIGPYGWPDSFVHLHYRAQRRFIGPLWMFRYPNYFVKLLNNTFQ